MQVRLWLSELSGDISIGWAESAPPLVGIGSSWLPKLGGDQSTLAKNEIIYPKNVRAKVAMDFT